MPAPLHLHDFTNVDTIYCTLLKTLQLKIKIQYLADPEIELQTIQSSYDIYKVLGVLFEALDEDQEHVLILILNVAQELTGYKLIASGTQEIVVFDNKKVFRSALLLGASAIIIAHNHPAGHLDPSEYDLKITKEAVGIGNALGLPVLDHIIYTPKGYTSLRHVAPEIFE